MSELEELEAKVEAQKKWLLKNRWDTPAERERANIKIEAYNTVLSELGKIRGRGKPDVEYWWRIVQYEAQELDKARTLEEARAKKKKWEEKFPSSTVAIWDETGHQIE